MKPFTPPPVLNLDLDATREEQWSLDRVSAALSQVPNALDASTAAAIGPLSIATRTHQDHHDHWHQFRSQPLPEFGGAEFRFDIPRGRILPKNPIIEDIADSAPAFVRARGQVVARADEARGMASEALRRLTGAWREAELVSVGASVGRGGQPVRTVLEIRTLGHGLFPIVERVSAASSESLEIKLDALVERHARRARLRASLLADGAIGWIDETARRILAAVGKDARWVMPLLEERGTVNLWMAVDPGSVHARIRWREGVLKAEYGNPGLNLDVQGDVVTVFRLLPTKVLAARIGGPLGRLTKDHFLPPETILFDAERQANGWTDLTVAIPKTLIPIPRSRVRSGGR